MDLGYFAWAIQKIEYFNSIQSICRYFSCIKFKLINKNTKSVKKKKGKNALNKWKVARSNGALRLNHNQRKIIEDHTVECINFEKV